MLDNGLKQETDLVKIIRDNRHAYAEEFGNTVVAPAEMLFNIMLQYALSDEESKKNVFSQEDRLEIIEAYKKAIKGQANFDQIALPIDRQLKSLKNTTIPDINANLVLFNKVLAKDCNTEKQELRSMFAGTPLVPVMNYALKHKDFCEKLGRIDHKDYGENLQFEIRAEVRKYFAEQTGLQTQNGNSPISIDFQTKSGHKAKAEMNLELFRSHLLGNIFNNFVQHAFIDEYSADKRIRVKLFLDEIDPKTLCIQIENNGKPFQGDMLEVFNEGVGEGTGIGLYSAKQFITHYGGNIVMYQPDKDAEPCEVEYTVGFEIKIPIV